MPSPARPAAIPAALLILAACADGPTPLDPAAASPPLAPAFSAPGIGEQAARHLRLAHHLALALQDDGFRATVYRALSESSEPEGKVHLQRFLGEDRGASRRRLAELAGESEAAIGADLEGSQPIEIYLPVPQHRLSWSGGLDVLVATAESDRAPPSPSTPRAGGASWIRCGPPQLRSSHSPGPNRPSGRAALPRPRRASPDATRSR